MHYTYDISIYNIWIYVSYEYMLYKNIRYILKYKHQIISLPDQKAFKDFPS